MFKDIKVNWDSRRAYCDEKFEPLELQMEHLVPQSKSGGFTRDNILPACKVCNNKKQDMMTGKWLEV